MSIRHLLPMLALLVGCPSPPDDAKGGPGGGGPPNAPSQSANGGPGGPGGGPGGNAGGPPKNGSPPAGGGAPPEGGPPPEGGAPPADGAPGEGGAPPSDQPGEGGDQKGPPPPDGEPQAEPAIGFGPGHNDQNPGGRSVVSTVAETVNKDDDGDFDQERVRAMEEGTYTIYRGEAKCSGCSGDLILRALPFFAPNEAPPENVPGVFTHMKLDGPGSFEIAVPDRGVPVVLELLVDKNRDGHPTRGERFAMFENRGGLFPQKPVSGLVIDASSDAGKIDSTDPLVPGEPIKPRDAVEQ